ncbi:hypothetical protein GGS23DRAFT_579364 [Durotheca rogersii]|uniref:uncharacterized protein n=1 Tax=Durotheca rogersii TaxID=419775 RepID=UPI00222024AC|nr:uncharacterized protein GGS23DRAFT_579364 [Durotheca rogersii]KAI5860886.1 hypothetical protein GGS23DRAFT_579364 [Durotheca rogersii]
MALPLTPAQSSMLNIATPPASRLLDKYEATARTTEASREPAADRHDMSSPPPAPQATDEKGPAGHNQENVSPSKSRHSRILSGTELSPLKILSAHDVGLDLDSQSPRKQSPFTKNPRKISRFPVRINNGSLSPTPDKQPSVPPVREQEMSLEEALRQNEGLATAIQIFEDDDTALDDAHENDPSTSVAAVSTGGQHADADSDEDPSADDTAISALSTFSAVPDMTMFAKIGHSPTRFTNAGMSPASVRSRPEPSPLRNPRPPTMHESGNTTNLLMDFTDQLPGRLSSSRAPQSAVAATPHHQQSNLLDFEIPPLPTPRSIPTITPRELESLKSGFLSEISSLKASLSGKEAEVSSLKTAVGDAEKRVGECMEQLREDRAAREALAEEKDSWERRGREMEAVLRKVKEEIVIGQREREELEFKFEESEKRREAAEMMAQEAESKMAGMRAGKATSDASSDPGSNKSSDKTKNSGSRDVEIAVERVARELHALYKSKHETKVAALKKSYENRWEKKVRELEGQVGDLAEENERLKLGRDATMTRVDPNQSIVDEERKAQAARDSAQIKELNAEIQKLEAVVHSIKTDNFELHRLLEKERVEKGELVQLAEEMMSIQSIVQAEPTPARPAIPRVQPTSSGNFRNSISGRPSGLKAPGSAKKPTESRIGGISHERAKNGGSQGGLPRPSSGIGMRSGIMSSIEKMGNYRGRGE